MQHNKGIEKAVVAVNGLGNLGPALGIDGTAIKQAVKLKYGEAHMLGIGAQRGTQTRKRIFFFPRGGRDDGGDFSRR